jgi:hypothetical protein
MDYKKYSPATSEFTPNNDLENTIPRNYKNDYNQYNKGVSLKRPIFNEPLREKNEIISYPKNYNQCIELFFFLNHFFKQFSISNIYR